MPSVQVLDFENIGLLIRHDRLVCDFCSSKAEPVRRPAMLLDNIEICIGERVVPDQIVVGIRQRRQAFLLGG